MADEEPFADLPDGWQIKRLADLAELQSGGTPSKKRPDFWQGSIPWASPKDMKRPYLFDAEDHISEEGLADGSRRVPAGALFIVVRGMILERDIPISLAAVPMAFNQDMKAIVPNGQVDGTFLLFALRQFREQLRKDVGSSAHGTKRISTSAIEGFRVPLPPLPEQRAIAGVLRAVQRAKEAVVASARQLKRSLLRHLFTYGPVPIDRADRVPLKDTDIGPIPEHWDLKPLGEVANIERGKFTHRPRNEPVMYGGSTPFIQTGDVARSGGRITTYTQTLSERGLTVSRVFPKGTIVLTIAANIADTGILEFDSAFPDSLVGISPQPSVRNDYLEMFLRTQKAEMDRLAPKGTQKNINIQFLKPWPTAVPPTDDQNHIAVALATAAAKIAVEESRVSALGELFRSLLGELMTGRVRVHDLDIPAEAGV